MSLKAKNAIKGGSDAVKNIKSSYKVQIFLKNETILICGKSKNKRLEEAMKEIK